MASLAAARSAVRSTARSSRLAVRSNSPSTPFRVFEQPQNRFNRRPSSFSSPMALSRRLGSMLPYHTATASSLLTSMLSLSDRAFIWTHEDDP